MVLEAGIAAKQALAEGALERLEFHVDALRVVFQVRNRFECFSTVGMLAAERTDAFSMGQKMVFQVLLLLERLVAAVLSALELALVALQVPVQLALANELLVEADWALEL